MASKFTPFPILDEIPEQAEWPSPPFAWRHLRPPANDVAQPCRIEVDDGKSISGEMTGFKDLLTQIFTTPSGLLFLAVGNIVGALIALVVFSFSAVSFPMLYDRDVDFVTAMVSSIRLVLKNPVVMLSWGAIIGVLTVISILSAFLGLIVTLPVLGHATWHLYRRGVAPSGETSAAARSASYPSG